ncbi:MAG: Maf family protein [Sphaerochaeta sp.]
MLSTYLESVILASQSSARKELLETQGVEVVVRPTWANEVLEEAEPKALVTALARRKLDTYLAENPAEQLPVLAFDTIIAFEGNLLGKPASVEEARLHLFSFSGRAQHVWSGWALHHNGRYHGDADLAIVHFKQLSSEQIEEYLAGGEWMGAAGSYRVQGEGSAFIDRIEGDEAVVIGIPLVQMESVLSSL